MNESEQPVTTTKTFDKNNYQSIIKWIYIYKID